MKPTPTEQVAVYREFVNIDATLAEADLELPAEKRGVIAGMLDRLSDREQVIDLAFMAAVPKGAASGAGKPDVMSLTGTQLAQLQREDPERFKQVVGERRAAAQARGWGSK